MQIGTQNRFGGDNLGGTEGKTESWLMKTLLSIAKFAKVFTTYMVAAIVYSYIV